jgi:hypothetical protein
VVKEFGRMKIKEIFEKEEMPASKGCASHRPQGGTVRPGRLMNAVSKVLPGRMG